MKKRNSGDNGNGRRLRQNMDNRAIGPLLVKKYLMTVTI